MDKNSPIFYYFFSTQDLLGKMSDIRSFFNAKPKKTVGVGDGGNGSTQISPHDAKPKVWSLMKFLLALFFYQRATTDRVHVSLRIGESLKGMAENNFLMKGHCM